MQRIGGYFLESKLSCKVTLAHLVGGFDSTHLKNISQILSSHQAVVNIKNI